MSEIIEFPRPTTHKVGKARAQRAASGQGLSAGLCPFCLPDREERMETGTFVGQAIEGTYIGCPACGFAVSAQRASDAMWSLRTIQKARDTINAE